MENPFRQIIPVDTRLIETFGWSPLQGFQRLDLHLARMARSAAVFGFAFDDTAARDMLVVTGEGPLRCRLTLGQDGFAFTCAAMVPVTGIWTLSIAPQRLKATDPWLVHKTTQRALYDNVRAALPVGVDEAIFLNERDEVCEGTITNLFVERDSGQLVTPPLSCGVLPGVLRQHMIETGQAQTQIIDLEMLQTARQILVGNSLRGLIPSRLPIT